MITSRAWTDADYGALSELLSANAAGGLPDPPMLLPGDLAWRLPGSHPEQYLRLFHVDSELAAFAWFEPLTGFEFDLRRDLTRFALEGLIQQDGITYDKGRRTAELIWLLKLMWDPAYSGSLVERARELAAQELADPQGRETRS